MCNLAYKMSTCIPPTALSPTKARAKTISINLQVISAVCASVLSRLSRLCRETLHYMENLSVLVFSVTKCYFLSTRVL